MPVKYAGPKLFARYDKNGNFYSVTDRSIYYAYTKRGHSNNVDSTVAYFAPTLRPGARELYALVGMNSRDTEGNLQFHPDVLHGV